MQQGPPRRRRPRPVADGSIDTLLLRTVELAKGWLLALVEEAPLDEAPGILAGDLARDGPRVCDAVVRALTDDTDLRRIAEGGALEPLVSRTGEFAGARSAEAAVRAVDALHGVVWSALRGDLTSSDAGLVADVAERLTFVIELVREAVLRRPDHGGSDHAPGPPRASLRVAREPPAADGEDPVTGDDPSAEVRAYRSASDAIGVPVEAPVGPREVLSRPVRDALWVGALEDEIVAAERTRSTLSLLLVELEEAERMLAVEPRGEAAATFGRFAQAVRSAVRRRDVLACETDTRAWIIARDTGRTGAQALGARIASAVPTGESWRGAPLTVSVGLAVLGEDGHTPAALIDAAEQARFAAAASGIAIVENGPGDGAGKTGE